MRAIKLTKHEKAIETALLRGEYASVGKKEITEVAQALAHRRKDAVLNIRVNRLDLENLKKKAQKMGLKYQTFVSEILHKVASA